MRYLVGVVAVLLLAGTAVSQVVKDVRYQTAEPGERADVYLPAPHATSAAAVIWMHGNHHDKSDAREQEICTRLAGAGYVAVSINYGSWPDSDAGEEHSPRILQNIANARSAVRYFRAHARDYGIDPKRIALFGASAGAWTALMAGLDDGDEVKAIGDFYGDTDPWLKSKITKQSPPVLIVHGKADAAVDYHESVELDQLLETSGVGHRLVLLEGVGHGFDLAKWQNKPLPRDLLPVVVAFLEEHLVAGDAGDDPLAHLRAEHPRLLFTEEDLAKAEEDAKVNPLRAELNKHIIATAEEILHAPPVRQPDRAAGAEQDRYAVFYITTCAMAYRLTGDERFLERAKSDLLTVSQFPDWAPKHFLSVGEMSFAVGIGYDWLYAKLTPQERGIIRTGLVKDGLSFADEVYGNPTVRKADFSRETTGNWNQVCNSGLVSGALAIADEEPDLARKIIRGALGSYPNGMKAYEPDGGFPEGPGYWTYATTYAAIAFAEMKTALGTDFGLPGSAGFDRTINYYEAVEGPFGAMFNYADATDDLQISPVRAWLAKRFDEPFALAHARELLADYLKRERVSKFDRVIQGTVVNRFLALHEVWFPENENPAGAAGAVVNPPLDEHFRGVADIATFRSAWNDSNALYVGFKAGTNDIHHGHLDLGSFVLDADGQRWSTDLGPDKYELPGYFDVKNGQRWRYFRANNHGHGTVTPGEAIQKVGGVAPIVSFGSEEKRGFAVADLTAAYGPEVKSLRRGVAILDRSRVLVEDEYEPAASGVALHWVMITGASMEVSGDGREATLSRNGKTMRAELLEPEGAQFSVGPALPPTAAENQNEGMVILGVDVAGKVGSATRVAVLFTPVGEKWPKLERPVVKALGEW